MKLKELNKVIKEGEVLLYDFKTLNHIVYDNNTRKKYEDYTVHEIYPILESEFEPFCWATLIIEIYREDN